MMEQGRLLIWDNVAKYPEETIIAITVILIIYYGYLEISKYWHQPLYTTKYGEWRVYRYIGRLIQLEDKNSFKGQLSENKAHVGYIKIRGQPKRKIILNNKDILERTPNKIVMNKRYLMWDTKKSAYVLTDERIKGYLSNPQNIEKFLLTKIDNIDMKATRSARASPIVIHNSLLHQHVPLDSGMYTEKEEDTFTEYSDYIFDREEVGGYQTYEEYIDESDEKMDRRKEKTPLRVRGRDNIKRRPRDE